MTSFLLGFVSGAFTLLALLVLVAAWRVLRSTVHGQNSIEHVPERVHAVLRNEKTGEKRHVSSLSR